MKYPSRNHLARKGPFFCILQDLSRILQDPARIQKDLAGIYMQDSCKILQDAREKDLFLQVLQESLARWFLLGWVDFEIFKTLYRFLFIITATLLQCWKCISVGFSQVKLILRCILKCKKFRCHFIHVNPYY